MRKSKDAWVNTSFPEIGRIKEAKVGGRKKKNVEGEKQENKRFWMEGMFHDIPTSKRIQAREFHLSLWEFTKVSICLVDSLRVQHRLHHRIFNMCLLSQALIWVSYVRRICQPVMGNQIQINENEWLSKALINRRQENGTCRMCYRRSERRSSHRNTSDNLVQGLKVG